MKKRSEEKINSAIEAFVNQDKIRKGYYRTSIQKVWKELMGELVAEYTSSIQISGEKLILEFTSAPLKQEILFKKEKLIQMINDRFGKEVIKKVVIR